MSEKFEWKDINNRDELEEFYKAIIGKIREAAKNCGYAIGVHGSLRRDFDLIAVPWVDEFVDKDKLASEIQKAACGLVSASYSWERKPNGRMATAFPICWTWHENPMILSNGHIDLSVLSTPEPVGEDLEARFLTAITDWKHHWMNQTQNSEEDRKNYFNRAFGVDANMKHDLARRLSVAFSRNPPANDAEILKRVEDKIREIYENVTTDPSESIFFGQGAHFALDLSRKHYLAEGVRLCLEVLRNTNGGYSDIYEKSADWLEKTMREKGVLK